MANPFDQFDAPKANASGNPFDQFDTPKKQGFFDFVTSQPLDAADAFGHHLGNLTHGAAQFIENGLASGAEKIAPGSAAAKWLRKQADSDNAAMAAREKSYQANVPDSPGSYAGATLGELAPFILAGGTSAPAAVAQVANKGSKMLNVAKTVAKNSAIGTGVAATQPVTGDGPYWDEKNTQLAVGAAAAPVLAGLGYTAGGLYNAVRPLVSPSSTVGNGIVKNLLASKAAPAGVDSAGNVNALTGNVDPKALIQRLLNAPEYVPGSVPTTAQVAGSPEFVMAEKTLKNNPAYRTAFENKAITNNQARLSVLRDVAKTPEELDAAMTARKDATKPLYDATWAKTHPVDDDLQRILARPDAQEAIARGRRLAANQNIELPSLTGTAGTPEQAAASTILDASGRPIVSTMPAQAATPGQLNGNLLQYLKMGLDDMVNGNAYGIGTHEAKALDATRGDLHNWIVNNAPDFAKANSLYAEKSVPVNTMQVGQDLYDALSNGALNAAGDISPVYTKFHNQYAKVMKNAKYGIDPTAQAALDGVESDLQRETISNAIRSSGSDSIYNAQAPNWLSGKLFGNQLDGQGIAPKLAGALLGSTVPGLGTLGGYLGAEKLGQFVGNRVNAEFQKAMLDPKYMAQLLQDALDRQAGLPPLFNSLSPIGAGATAIGGGEPLNALTNNR